MLPLQKSQTKLAVTVFVKQNKRLMKQFIVFFGQIIYI